MIRTRAVDQKMPQSFISTGAMYAVGRVFRIYSVVVCPGMRVGGAVAFLQTRMVWKYVLQLRIVSL